MKTLQKSADVVVAGSGPGGATVAALLAKAGKKVIVLEKGRWHKWLGNHLSALRFIDRMGLHWSEEGVNIVRAMTAGGSTVIYCGAATEPPDWFRTDYGIDLAPYLEQTIEELDLTPLPDEVVGTAGMRLLEAANDLGYGFVKFRKFIDGDKCKSRCGGTCILGCPHDAKWGARAYLGEMIEAGGELITRAEVHQVTAQDNEATGVLANIPGGQLEVKAPTVIISAGGIGTPSILQNSGIYEAGRGMCIDPLVVVSGVSRFKGTSQGPPMSVGTYDYINDGIVISDMIDPWGIWLIMVGLRNTSHLLDFLAYRRQLSLFVKIADARLGSISPAGRVSKPLGDQDRHRLNHGAAMARRILIKAGCRPDSIIIGPVRGAHPMSTAPIGRVVDENLATEVKNLYVSDASVIPRALDRPVVLTLLCLAKRLADHLLGRASVDTRQIAPGTA